MKNSYKTLKLVCCITGIICFSNKTNAQNWQTSGNTLSSGDFIGSTNYKPLIFKTNDTLRMKIDANGDIKMKGKLVVDSSANFKGPVSFNGPSGDAIIPEPGITPFIGPTQDDHWFSTDYYCIMGAKFGIVTLPFPHFGFNPVSLKAFGVSTQNPLYMLDVKCDPAFGSKSDINVYTTAATQNVGYRIGGNYVLWHNGNTDNIYVGVGAGLTATGDYNTFVGHNSGNTESSNDNTFTGYNTGPLSNGYENTLTGYNCGSSMTTAVANTFAGSQSGHNTTTGSYNTMTGRWSGFYNTIGMADNFYGKEAGYHNVSGNSDCFYGNHSGWTNNDGNDNCAFGGEAFYSNFNGNSNVAIGENDMYSNYDGSANVSVGLGAMYSSLKGSGNVAIGTNADRNGGSIIAGPDTLPHDRNVFIGSGAVPSYLFGDSNVFVGSLTDVNTFAHNITNSGAIGFGAIATANNKFILGNNQQNIGIGMSNITGGPTNKMEISYYSLTSPSPAGVPVASTFASVAGSGTATGTSGLQFRDLTDASIQYPYVTNQGFLTVDDKGNVVYMQSPTGGGSGFGALCSSSTPYNLTGDWRVGLHGYNFYFSGNNAGTNVNNVTIGRACGYTPVGKLDVHQKSGSTTGSTGIYVENDDPVSTTFTPVIGIKSFIPASSGAYCNYNVAGWFEADGTTPCSGTSDENYALFTPKGGGVVSIGLPFASGSAPIGAPYLLQVAGQIWSNGVVVGSDRRYKTNIAPIKNALNKIDSINPIYFYYDTISYPNKEFSNLKQVGFVAQNVDSVLPEVVSKGSDGYYNLDYARMTALLLAGEKELKLKSDSLNGLKQTVDSIRTVLNSIQYCINKLCDSTSHSATQPNVGSNSENTTNITLSNSAILYQNTPNPFNENGTKISYFLPENSTGASIVFYDMYGSKLNEVQLTQTGMGTINVNPDRSSTGVYSYSLVVNGQVLDTKKMVYAK